MNQGMNKIYILNASPIILLGKANLFNTIAPLADTWIVPEGVVEEVESKRSISSYLPEAETRSAIPRQEVQNIHPLIASWDLGRGESEVLTLAMQKSNSRVVLDDLQARKSARLFNIPLIGTLGLVIMAKRYGYIRHAKPEIEKLKEAGLHIDNSLLESIYSKIGE